MIYLIITPIGFVSYSVNMAHPGSEPAHTDNPYTGLTAPAGSLDVFFHFETYSLRDVGVYTFDVVGQYTDGYYVYDLTYADFMVEVDNWPPSASPTISGDPRVGGTFDLRANSEDNDPGKGSETGGLDHDWDITQPGSPSGSIASPSSRNTTITFVDEDDIGNWTIRLSVDDNEEERITVNLNFYVDEIPPDVDILGDTDINALEDIYLHASTNVDGDGGPPLTFEWEIIDFPSTNMVDLSAVVKNQQAITIPTTGTECGVWQFRLTTRDNEDESPDVDVETVTVHNLTPSCTVEGLNQIVVGENICFEVTPVDDPDGGILDITWDLIQSPDESGIAPMSGYTSGAILDIATFPDFAGTWIFDVHVYDDEVFEQYEFHQRVQVLVDARPIADAVAVDPAVSFLDTLVLDASGSVDPDTDNPHTNSEGSPVLSDGLTYYDWHIIEMPSDAYGYYFYGPVDEVLGTINGTVLLDIGPGMLTNGRWSFEVGVYDAEGNVDYATVSVDVINPDSAPWAIVLPPVSLYNTDLSGELSETIHIDGSLSFDPDNLLDDSYMPGLGIDHYEWSLLLSPPGCASVPSLPGGPTALFAEPFTAGTSLPSACNGLWFFGLTVRDDEAALGYGTAMVMLGNCAGNLCIDYPTTDDYEYIEFSDNTDVTIYYHLNSLLYNNPAFTDGMYLELEIFHEDDPATPVYSAHYDYDMLPSDRGGFLTFHWHGYTNSGERPLPGKYTIRISACSPSDPFTTIASAIETDALWIEVVDVEIDSSSDTLFSLNSAEDGQDVLNLTFVTSTYFTVGDIYDYAELVIWEQGADPEIDSELYREALSDPLSGIHTWSGELAPEIFILPGHYSARIEVYKDGHLLGTSPMHDFTAYRIDCAVTGVTDEDEEDPGVVMGLGDSVDGTITLLPDDGTLTGEIFIQLLSAPGLIEITDSGAVVLLDGTPTYTPTTLGTGKTVQIEVIDTINSPAELQIRFEPTGGTPSQVAADYLVIHSLTIELSTDSNNNGSIGSEDDAVEATAPGVICWINADDDNDDGNPDYAFAGPVTGENDLIEVQLEVAPPTLEGTVTLTAPVGDDKIFVWDDSLKTTAIVLDAVYTLGTDIIPPSIYIEGYDAGMTHLKLEYRDLSNTLIHEDEIYISVMKIDIDIDTNRSGTIDDTDEPGEDEWSGTSGAIFHYNNDNDDEATNSELDAANTVIDGPADYADMAILFLNETGISALPAGWEIGISVPWHHENVRIFDNAGIAVIGEGIATEYTIPDLNSADLNYRIETVDYPSASPTPPEYTIRLSLSNTSGVVFTDDVKIRTAPFLMTDNLDPANEMFVVELPGSSYSVDFIADLTAICTTIGLPLTVVDGSLYGNDRWIQDELEFGFTTTPHMDMEVILESARNVGIGGYIVDALFGADVGWAMYGTSTTTYNYFGNLECTPPIDLSSTPEFDYPQGRIYFGGDTAGGAGPDVALQEFLEMQEVQSPFMIDTSWLYVKHVDEIISFVPFPDADIAAGDKPYKLLVASPDAAEAFLSTYPDQLYVPPKIGETIENILLNDTAFNDACQLEIVGLVADLTAELGLQPDDIIYVPVWFREHGTLGLADSLFTNMVNLISVNGHLIIADPHFPDLRDEMTALLEAIGYSGTVGPGQTIHYIDDWDEYHVNYGEIHCGTNVERDPGSSADWWDQY